MMIPDPENLNFKLAAEFINHSSQNVFLTGKAGSGKTTFLKYIVRNTHKSAVVVAPTGVAAINAGGVTMHSLLQLPFGPFIPGNKRWNADERINDNNSLLSNLRLNAEKRELLQELELLVIDEVSMVRADMLDATDAILRSVRKKPFAPFGGVQLLFIGDLYQLPPVVNHEEWSMLKETYKSPYFFDALVLQQTSMLYIELKKIYRQNEQHFIDILNRIRQNSLDETDLEFLHQRYDPGFKPTTQERYITLCTHNSKADTINAQQLSRLEGAPVSFEAEVKGEFPDKSLPAERTLQLKPGAQVMFIKNDPEKRFFNGKLATISKIEHEKITVVPEGSSEEIVLGKETWKHIRYTYNKAREEVEEEELGTFVQYPLRLAWAVTIHKSQGLTFERAIIDAGRSFAPGQVYVALSRCTTLEGIVLLSPISRSGIANDERIISFSQKENSIAELEEILQASRNEYNHARLIKIFDWTQTTERLYKFCTALRKKKSADPSVISKLTAKLLDLNDSHRDVSKRFAQVLSELIAKNDSEILKRRVDDAATYFTREMRTGLIRLLDEHEASLKGRIRTKKYVGEIAQLRNELQQKIKAMEGASALVAMQPSGS